MPAITSEATIRIVYDGEALKSGSMDVRDLAPALLALSDLFDEADKVLNGPNPDRAIQLRIRHDIKKGSFDIGIEVVQTWLTKVINLFASDSASGIANLIEILGLTVAAPIGLFKLIRWLRGRPVKRVELLSDGGARMIVEGEELLISRPLAKVFNDVGVRKALAAVMSPLERDGIDTFEVKDANGNLVESVSKGELPAFAPPDPVEMPPEKIVENTFTQAYTIVSVTFKDGNKWRVSDGQSTFNVTLEDKAFIDRVNRHEVQFAKDDMIRCEVRQRQTMSREGLSTEFFISRVLQHTHTFRQVVLPFENAPAPPEAPKEPPPEAPPAETVVESVGKPPPPKKRGGKKRR